MTVIHVRSRKSIHARGNSPDVPAMVRPRDAALTTRTHARGPRVKGVGRQEARAARQLAKRDGLPLNDRQAAALAIVTAAEEDGATAGDVMAALQISRSSATGVLRALVLRDLIDYRGGRATLKAGASQNDPPEAGR